MLKATCGVQLKERKRAKDFKLSLNLNETIDQSAMANSVCWYGHVLRKEDGHVLKRALVFGAESQRKQGKPKRT